MEIFYKSLLLVPFILHLSFCDVHLKVFFNLPIVRLECTITYPKEVASVILMCPSDKMCFQNCDRLCDPDSCKSNNISCSIYDIGNLKKFIYVFDLSILENQGEWICHYGTEKGSTAIFYSESSSNHAKREVKIVPMNSTNFTEFINSHRNKVTEEPKSKSSSAGFLKFPFKTTSKTILTNVNPYYVILLLMIFSISLLINIIFLVRDVLTSITTKKSIDQSNKDENSYWLVICVKLFCVEKVFNIKQDLKRNPISNEINPLISRQVSSNVYEYPAAFHLQPPLYLENIAYMRTPSNERVPYANGYAHSTPFLLKSSELKLGQPNASPIITAKNRDNLSNLEQSIPTNEFASQIIYDDVAEPSVHYIPFDNPIYCSSLARPNNRISRHISMQRKNQLAAMSLNNINFKSKCPSDTGITVPNTENGVLLKDAINSRVELSKEMINQADSLLRQADNLLNRKEP